MRRALERWRGSPLRVVHCLCKAEVLLEFEAHGDLGRPRHLDQRSLQENGAVPQGLSLARLCIGGSHRLSNALARVIQEPGGGHLRGSIRIKRIVVENGKASGVELENGTVYEAEKAVVSSIDPHQTFLELVGEEHLPEEFAEKIRMWHR